MMPPMLMKISIYENGARRWNLWLPLLLVYFILSPVFILLLPVLVLAGIAVWIFGGGDSPFTLFAWFYELWCATKGTIIETQSKNEHVYIRIF